MLKVQTTIVPIASKNCLLQWNSLQTRCRIPTFHAHVVHTTAKQVILLRRKNEDVFKMSKDEKYTCKACKNTVFHCQICKFVGFLSPSSSWLVKLPIVYASVTSADVCLPEAKLFEVIALDSYK